MRPFKFTEEELIEKCTKEQQLNPLYSEGAVMGKLGVDRHHLQKRSKSNDRLAELREEMAAIRERAWIEQGITGMGEGQGFNATVFIWMTRNILGWRDKHEPEETQVQAQVTISPDTIKEMLTLARGKTP